ncbi:GNAT family N-acetyltransferase [Salidesulfovibrio brasiliensis]
MVGQMTSITHDCAGVNWQEAAELMRTAPLADRKPDVVRRCFENSDVVAFAWQDGRLVGMTRMLSDHTCQAVLYDLCVLPQAQGTGVGRQLMKAALKRCDAPSVVLWAVPGKEGFYEKFGFRPMLTAMANFADPESSRLQGYIR